MEGGTTGGEGGRTVRISNVDSLKELMDSNEKLIIEISGTINLEGAMVALRSDKTLIGLGDNARIINGGLELYKRNNIIIRNITFVNAPDDLLKVNQNTTHLWVDHCTFTDGDTPDPEGENHDGLFDITRQSNFITVSYCLFLNHSKSILIGHSDSFTDDVGYLKTTLHHNWFNGTRQRHPRVRYGEVHCFNNYYQDNELYGAASTCEADVVLEGNYFQNVPFPAYVGYAESPDGDVVEKNNAYSKSGVPETRGTAFDPKKYYTYTPDPAENVPAIVKASAGAGGVKTATEHYKLTSFSPAAEIWYQSMSNKINFISGHNGNAKLMLVDPSGRLVRVLFNASVLSGQANSVTIPDMVKGAYFSILETHSERKAINFSFSGK